MSFWRHYYHIVWATKARRPLITAQVEVRLYGYLVSKACELETHVYAINGIADHVHLVASIPPLPGSVVELAMPAAAPAVLPAPVESPAVAPLSPPPPPLRPSPTRAPVLEDPETRRALAGVSPGGNGADGLGPPTAAT